MVDFNKSIFPLWGFQSLRIFFNLGDRTFFMMTGILNTNKNSIFFISTMYTSQFTCFIFFLNEKRHVSQNVIQKEGCISDITWDGKVFICFFAQKTETDKCHNFCIHSEVLVTPISSFLLHVDDVLISENIS